MGPGAALALGLLVVVTVLLAAAFAWYNFWGWAPFRFAEASYDPGAPPPSWSTPGGTGSVADLRFKDAVFTVVDPGGATHTADVTDVLNGMAAAYRGSPSPPSTLTLAGPLNAFSFVIPGVNDRAAVPDPKLWAGSPAALAGKMRAI